MITYLPENFSRADDCKPSSAFGTMTDGPFPVWVMREGTSSSTLVRSALAGAPSPGSVFVRSRPSSQQARQYQGYTKGTTDRVPKMMYTSWTTLWNKTKVKGTPSRYTYVREKKLRSINQKQCTSCWFPPPTPHPQRVCIAP